MKTLQLSLTVISILIVRIFASAQQTTDLSMGDKLYDTFEFTEALYYYEIVHEQRPADASITRKIGDTYRRMGQLNMSAEWYRRTIELDGTQPEDMIHYAEALKSLMEYDEAIEWYARYDEVMPNDKRAQSHLKDPNYFNDLQADSMKYVIKRLAINSADPAIGVCFFEDGKFLISSMRLETPTPDQKKKWEKQLPYLDIYSCEINEADELIKPEILSKNVNSKYHDGPVSYNKKNKTLYITRNNIRNGKPVRDKRGSVNLKIYEAELNNGEWSGAHELKFNSDEFSNGHPCITRDGNFMYFVSNRDGGFGGTDIYITQRINEGWTEPVNLGSNVNSEGDEMFPFIADNGALYFASNGWAGLGGLDIFRSDMTAGKWEKAINVGFPINSNEDDFGLLYDNNDDSGFFCSNRQGNGNDDVYYFNTLSMMKMIVAGAIHSDVAGKSLAGERILITSLETGIVTEDRLNAKEEFSFEATAGERIEVRLAAEEFQDDKPVFAYSTPKPIYDPYHHVGTYYVTPNKMQQMSAALDKTMDAGTLATKLSGKNKPFIPAEGEADEIEKKSSGLGLLSMSGSVADMVSYDPLDQVTILASTNDGKKMSIVTDANGRFNQDVPQDSDIKLTFNKDGYKEASLTLTADNLKASAENLTIKMEKAASAMPSQLTIYGSVSASDYPNGLSGIEVTLANAPKNVKPVLTDDQGNFTITVPFAKEVKLTFEKDGYATKTIDVPNASAKKEVRNVAIQMTKITDAMAENGKLNEVASVLPEYVEIVGSVTAQDYPTGLAGIKVSTALASNSSPVFTDEKGNFKITVPYSIDVKLTLEKEGYATKTVVVPIAPGDYQAQNAKVEMNRNADALANKVTMLPNDGKQEPGFDQMVDLESLSINNVQFDYDKAYIREDGKPILDQIAVIMKDYNTSLLVIRTYCDSRGSAVYNQQLSMSRAMAVKGYLMKKGINAQRMKMEYFGEERPLNDCVDNVPCTEVEYEVNRRAEFKLFTESLTQNVK